MTAEWLSTNLSDLLGFPLSPDMTNYISSIGNDKDLEDYIKTLIDLNNHQHRKFLQELLQRRKGKVVQEGYKKSEVDVNYISPKLVEKKKKGKNQTEDRQVKENVDNTELILKDKTKKKSKFVNLYSQEGQAKDVVLLKGRLRCDCQASKHKLINNCLKCGRIVCEQEGSGPCLFCGNLVCSREEQDFINSGTKQSSQLLQKLMDKKPPGWDAAMEQRNRLLEYDRTSEKRTRVIDDESDYFASNSVWLSQSERERVTQKEEEYRARRYGSRKDRQITFDIIGGQAIESVSQYDDFCESQDKALQDISNGFKSYSAQDDRNIDPTITDILPQFEENVIVRQRQQKSTGNKSSQSRVQDKEFLEMVDEGLCLSMHQPWASLLVAGIKQHEGRNWYTSHRGRLWIAATTRQPTREEIQEHENIYKTLKGDELSLPHVYPVSCLLGCVTVTNCLPQEEYRQKYPEGESDSPYVFICEDPQELTVRFPISGKHKIYRLDTKIHQAARKTLERVTKLRAEKTSQKGKAAGRVITAIGHHLKTSPLSEATKTLHFSIMAIFNEWK